MSYHRTLGQINLRADTSSEPVSSETESNDKTDPTYLFADLMAQVYTQPATREIYEPSDVSLDDQEVETYQPVIEDDFIPEDEVQGIVFIPDDTQLASPEEEKEVIRPITDEEESTPEDAILPRPTLNMTIDSVAKMISYDVCSYVGVQINTTTGQAIMNQLASSVEDVLVHYCGTDVTEIAQKNPWNLAEIIYSDVYRYMQDESIIGVIENTIKEVRLQILSYEQKVTEYEEQTQYDEGSDSIDVTRDDLVSDGGFPGPGDGYSPPLYYEPPPIMVDDGYEPPPEAEPAAQEIPWKTIAIFAGIVLLLK